MPKTFIITGGNAGLGFQCASTLNADRGNVIVLACRDVTAEIFLGWL
jgi:NAD(P)-dependent dehydrogenase (short-subunit alcohol dehydrogenase family)